MAKKSEEIGVLLVHGMGEQKRLDHLRASAKELASSVARAPGLIRLSVTENVTDKSESITLDAVFRRGGAEERVRLHLREVWWADLGISGGLFEQVKFWLWGLGQWAAQVVVKGDPSRNTVKLMSTMMRSASW